MIQRKAHHPITGNLEKVSLYFTGGVWVIEFRDGRMQRALDANFLQGKRSRNFRAMNHIPSVIPKKEVDEGQTSIFDFI